MAPTSNRVDPVRVVLLVAMVAISVGFCGCKFTKFGGGAKRRPSHTIRAGAAPTPSQLGSKHDSPAANHFNMLLLTVDALRADLPWLGYARNNAPRLSEFARESVVYTHAYSVSSTTSKSLAAMFTGRYPSSLHRSGLFFAGYTERKCFLASRLSASGIATLGWQVHPYLQHAKGLSSGYAEWKQVRVLTGDAANPQSTSPELMRVGMDLLGRPENTARQFFAWTHALDPHEAYVKHAECPDFGNRDRDRYDSEVCFTDKWIGNLLDWARRQPWWDNTVVIVTSDHGEAFGEHGMAHHAFELWESLVHVPLLIRVPGVPARRIELRRSQIDVAATILELMGQPVYEGSPGRSLAPELLGREEPQSHDPIVLDLPEDTHEQARRAIIEADYKLIDFGNHRYALYDLANDPAELMDIAGSNPSRLAVMKQKLAALSSGIPSVEPYGGMKLASGRIANGTLQADPKP